MTSAAWKTDRELFDLAKIELFTAVVGDILDQMGLFHQFLPPEIKALDRTMVLIGRAMPVLESDCFAASIEGNNPLSAKPFGYLFEALDDLKADEVYICTGSTPTYALWGGLMTTRALYIGAAGVVLDGYARDTKEIIDLKLPCFGYGGYAQDQGPRGKVVDWRVPIEVNGVSVKPGDIVFGDADGVLIIPQEVEEEAFTRALEKARGENVVEEAIRNGMPAAEAWKKYRIM